AGVVAALRDQRPESLENFVGGDLLHGLINGLATFICSRCAGAAEDLQGTAIRAVARRIGGTEDGDAGFTERGGEVQRTAIHTYHGGGAAGRVDEAWKTGNMNT